MKNLELIGIPILMLSDYYLTILGSIYKKGQYAEHFISETYELNPVWRKDVDKTKWVNYRHVLMVLFVTFMLYFLSQVDDVKMYHWLLGFFFTLFGMINGRHLNNLLYFKFLNNHPNALSGKIEVSHLGNLKISQYQVIILTVPVLILTILTPNAFMFGGLSSCLAFFIIHIFWIDKHKQKLKVLNKKSLVEAE